jgi:hypothetical protein
MAEITSTTRQSWNDLGIDRRRYGQLLNYCRDPANYQMVYNVAHKNDHFLAPWIIRSVTTGASFDKLEYTLKLGLIPCGRTNFYAVRRHFYALLNEELKGD